MVSQQFPNVTPERWVDIKQVFHSDAHIDIDADEGTSESHGIEFSWHYGENVLTATITVPHFGWVLKMAGFHTEDDVMVKFAAWIDGVQ
jgi:hypothetical protein